MAATNHGGYTNISHHGQEGDRIKQLIVQYDCIPLVQVSHCTHLITSWDS